VHGALFHPGLKVDRDMRAYSHLTAACEDTALGCAEAYRCCRKTGTATASIPFRPASRLVREASRRLVASSAACAGCAGWASCRCGGARAPFCLVLPSTARSKPCASPPGGGLAQDGLDDGSKSDGDSIDDDDDDDDEDEDEDKDGDDDEDEEEEAREAADEGAEGEGGETAREGKESEDRHVGQDRDVNGRGPEPDGREGGLGATGLVGASTEEVVAKRGTTGASLGKVAGVSRPVHQGSSAIADLSIPFTFQAPASLAQLEAVLAGRDPAQTALIVQRIRACNAVALAQENRGKLQACGPAPRRCARGVPGK